MHTAGSFKDEVQQAVPILLLSAGLADYVSRAHQQG